ncbi:MAG: transcription antitermination factor NusB [Planctomycetes bacterium]|nr:transcription antitermination factor NusB [Planctomycetota bacterium]
MGDDVVRVRTRARELALQFLYALDVQGAGYRERLDGFLHEELSGKQGEAEATEYAKKLVDGVTLHRPAIDTLLSEAAKNWGLGRMAVIDRNVLRIGCYEMLHERDVPTKVVINEAIELAKRYSTEQSGAFVNGILDRIRKDRGLPV